MIFIILLFKRGEKPIEVLSGTDLTVDTAIA
jgi:hypothetical protein